VTHEVRTVLLIATVIFLTAFAAYFLGLYPLVYLQFPVLLAMAWAIFDAAYHRDSVWREADQNKIVWVLVQFIPVLGTVGYYILVHRALFDAEDRVPRR
jgi:Phospholipase_D-nuclease N-terminal